VFNPGLGTNIVRAGFLVSRYGFIEFCAGGSYPIENPRENKRREKRPAPVVGLIVAACEESRKTAEKGSDLKDLGPNHGSQLISARAATNGFPRR